jgi:putative CocE/NonD family hydrolase
LKYYSFLILATIIGCSAPRIKEDDSFLSDQLQEYEIKDVLIKTRDGALISGMVARKKGDTTPRPVILQYTIYVRDTGRDIETIKRSVDNGYVGMIGYARGKRFSPDEINPYEHDANDVYDVIAWSVEQEWSDGRVGMYGGSYNGFTQWAATKQMHPALKTIVPYVASRPGMGLPMENNVFINPNYEWAFYVGNNKYLDEDVGNDRQRFRKMQDTWWQTGAAYANLDSIDGAPNKWFQRWISHPSYDDYWQDMAPYERDFAQIDIPILSVDGYYNDSQSSGLNYLREHYKYRPNAEHYLIIGPYSHFGAQRNGQEVINGYTVDADALIDTVDITYQWFDYIFNGAARPAIVKDKISYQVMGANEWRGAASIEDMSDNQLKLYFSNEQSEEFFTLSSEKPKPSAEFVQTVDFTDRGTTANSDYYPDPIIRDEINTNSGFSFVSDPIENPVLVNGSFSGELKVTINKRDFDFGVTLYEVLPDGRYFHLSYIVARASYAKDITQRQLLEPGVATTIAFTNTRLVSRQLQKGSRLLVQIDVNKNSFSELNYGTGKLVSTETIQDSGDPLVVQWSEESFVVIPILDM